MARRLLLLVDGLLLVAAAFLGVRLYEAWGARTPAVPPEAPPAVSTEALAPPAATSPRTPLTAFAVVAERNLFSPTRTETAPEPPRAATGAGAPAPPAPKPRLYGVVLLAGGTGSGLPGRRPAAAGLRVLGGGPRRGCPPRADQAGSGGAAPRGRDLRGAARRPFETSPVRRAPGVQSGVQSPEAGGAGRPAVARPPVPPPTTGIRAPGRPRAAVPPPAPPSTGDAGTADRGGMIEKLTRRRIAVLGLAVLGGCAGPGASGPKPPPSSKASGGTVTAVADGAGARRSAGRLAQRPGLALRRRAGLPFPRPSERRQPLRDGERQPRRRRPDPSPHRPEPGARSCSTSTTPTSRPSSRRRARSPGSTTRSVPASPGRRSRSRPRAGSRRTRSSTSCWPCSRSTASRPSARAISTRSCRRRRPASGRCPPSSAPRQTPPGATTR